MHNSTPEAGAQTPAEELVAEIQAFCIANQDSKKAQRYTRFFREGYDAWGLDKDHAFYTQKRPEWLERYRDLGLRGFFKAAEMLFATGKYEEGAAAIWFVIQLRDQFDAGMTGCLARFFRAGIRNWAHTDVLSGEVIAPLLADGRIELSSLAVWRESDLKFQRRAVPVSMLGLLKSQRPIRPLLDFLRPLMLDRERVVQQGLGWFLREAWKKYPKPVETFLKEWKDESPRLIFQYATEKMSPELRARFRRRKN
jgi:hypothetical protein